MGKLTHHIDEHAQRPFPFLDKLGSIVFFPFLLLVLAKVAFERLLSPRGIDWVGNGCECRDGLVHSGVLKELSCVNITIYCHRLRTYQCQGTMPAHAVASDTDSAAVEFLEMREQSFWKLFGNV